MGILVIGMIGVVIVFKVWAKWEDRQVKKRTQRHLQECKIYTEHLKKLFGGVQGEIMIDAE